MAVGWAALSVIMFCLPFTPSAIPFNDAFDWSALNYAPFVTGAFLLFIGIWWFASAKTAFRGAPPEKTVETS